MAPFDGVTVQAARMGHVEAISPMPGLFGRGALGRLESSHSDDFTAELVNGCPKHIDINVLRYKVVRGCFDTLTILGYGDDCEAVTINLLASEVSDPAPAPPPRPKPDAVDGDFLDDLCSKPPIAPRQRQEQQQQKRRRQAEPELSAALEDILLEERSAMEDLEKQLQEEMGLIDPAWAEEVAEELRLEEEEAEAEVEAAKADMKAEEAAGDASQVAGASASSATSADPAGASGSASASSSTQGGDAGPGHEAVLRVAAALQPAAAAAPATAADIPEMLRRHGWTDQSTSRRYYFHDESNIRRLTIFPLAGFKAECEFHSKCVCWLGSRAVADATANMQPLLELVQWGLEGKALDSNAHHASAQRLKARYGMRLRVTV